MKFRVLMMDVLGALLWMVVRFGPLTVFLLPVYATDPIDVGSWVIIAVWLVWYYVSICFITNTLPALFWRYNEVLETRKIYVSNDECFYQVKLYGIWVYIKMMGADSAILSLTKGWSFGTMEGSQYRFNENFASYINEPRVVDRFPITDEQLYINGVEQK